MSNAMVIAFPSIPNILNIIFHRLPPWPPRSSCCGCVSVSEWHTVRHQAIRPPRVYCGTFMLLYQNLLSWCSELLFVGSYYPVRPFMAARSYKAVKRPNTFLGNAMIIDRPSILSVVDIYTIQDLPRIYPNFWLIHLITAHGSLWLYPGSFILSQT